MARTEFNRQTRQQALARSTGLCEASGARYGLAGDERCYAPLSYGVIFDHDIPDALGGPNTLENCRAICPRCNKFKTGKNDVPQIRKADRQRAKHQGTWPASKAKIQSRGFDKSRVIPLNKPLEDHPGD